MENEMQSLKSFFEPKSIAVIGASNDIRKPGGKPLNALINKGYGGKIYPVNPKYTSLFGVRCYRSMSDISDEVELAVISLPAEGVYMALEQCIEKGVKAAVIFSSGFSESGPEGSLLQDRITQLARSSGLRLCGPNCLGVVNNTNGVMASFGLILDLPDIENRAMGFVTQSGAFGDLIYAKANFSGVGLNYFVSVGNEADLDFADFLNYMLKDKSTKVVGCYLEGAKDGWKLRRLAEEALALEKPVMIMKTGRSSAGARAASSHTGSMAGVDRIYDAFFKQSGIIRISSPDELISFVPIISSGRLPRGKNVALMSTSGGSGVYLADMCDELGLSIPRLNKATRVKMEAVLPSFASAQNPIDLTAQYMTNPEMLTVCLNSLLEDDQIDIILANINFGEPYGVDIARHVIEIYNSTDKTMVICPWVFPGTDEGDGVRELRRAGIPVLLDTFQAVKAIVHLADYAEYIRSRKGPEYKLPSVFTKKKNISYLSLLEGVLSESLSKDLLSMFGVPVTREVLAASADDAVSIAGQIGYPVVLKVDSPDIPHKTDAGALRLNLTSEDDIRKAYGDILHNASEYKMDARINGVLVQEMLPEGIEVIIGVANDPVFGPTIMFGLGGIFVEVLKDVSFRIAPLTRGDAMEMIREVKGYKVLTGVRGKPLADIEALADVILKVSAMVKELKDHIEELDINPLIVYPKGMGVKAADAVIVMRKKAE